MKIGIIREGKQPPDLRTPLVPHQCYELMNNYPDLTISLQPASFRCFNEDEYERYGVEISEDLSNCNVLLGIKEVPVEELIEGKTYMFFSHTIKKQPHNRNLLREILAKKIRLIDYETLVWENGSRILGFGHFAGIVGTHNGLLTYGKKFGLYELKPAYKCRNYLELKAQYKSIKLPPIKICLAGDGRVAHGALELLNFLGVREVTKKEFLEKHYDEPVFVHLRVDDLYMRKDGIAWDKSDFYHNPNLYESRFTPFCKVTDIMINAIFWKQGIPVFFTKEEMKFPGFSIKVIADISCDIDGSVPCTVKSTTIIDPVFGWHSLGEKVVEPFQRHTVDVMAVGNLPCELPLDASTEFGGYLMLHVLPELIDNETGFIIDHATITRDGELTPRYQYLQDYIS
jgi:saccharopine dehydrogenase (NAD+, L-lysine-forming)